jgi:YD repeat-containing protein
MTKTLFLLLIVCLSISLLHAQSEQHTGRILKNIRSAHQEKYSALHVKTITGSDCDVDPGFPVFICRYDTAGNLTDSIGYPRRDIRSALQALADNKQLDASCYEGDNLIDFKFHFTYDEKGLRTQVAAHTTARIEGTGSLSFANDTTTYTYDDHDRLIRTLSRNRNGVMIQDDIYSYDESGNLAFWKQFKSGSPRNFTNQYTYDDKNNLIEYLRTDAAGDFQAKERCTYDANGNMLTWENVAKSGLTLYKKTFTYDEYGDMTESLGYIEGDNFDSKLQKVYDNAGNVTETTFSSGRITGQGNFIFKDRRKESFFYDGHNNVVEKDTYNIRGDKTLIEIFNFDDNDNLIRTSVNPGPCMNIVYDYYN